MYFNFIHTTELGSTQILGERCFFIVKCLMELVASVMFLETAVMLNGDYTGYCISEC